MAPSVVLRRPRWLLLTVLLFAATTTLVASEYVYRETALEGSWESWSWGTPLPDFAYTAQRRSGSTSARFRMQAWSGLYLHSNTVKYPASYTQLEFYLNPRLGMLWCPHSLSEKLTGGVAQQTDG